MTFAKIAGLVAMAATAGFGGGFLWGVADHRRPEAIINFADQHIAFRKSDRVALLIFSCGTSEPFGYNLLTDEVLEKQKEIDALQSDPVNKVLESDLFSHSTAFAAEAFGVGFSFKDQLTKWKEGRRSSPVLVTTVAVVLSTGYLGYLASDLFRLECSTSTIYERLKDKKFWRPYRLSAAKVMFERLAYCVDRHVTVWETADSAIEGEVLRTESPEEKDRLNARELGRRHREAIPQWGNYIDQWRNYISVANRDLPQQSVIESRYRDREVLPGSDKPKTPATWGDSFYQRIYGEKGFRVADSDFDKVDFQGMFSVDRKCDQLDRKIAEDLYLKIIGSRKQSATSLAKYQQDFFNLRGEVVQRLRD
jgi:hypothetical protein